MADSVTEIFDSRIGDERSAFGGVSLRRQFVVKTDSNLTDPKELVITTLGGLKTGVHPYYNGSQNEAESGNRLLALLWSATPLARWHVNTHIVEARYAPEHEFPLIGWEFGIAASSEGINLLETVTPVEGEEDIKPFGVNKYLPWRQIKGGPPPEKFKAQMKPGQGFTVLMQTKARRVEGYQAGSLGYQFSMSKTIPNWPAGILSSLSSYRLSTNNGPFLPDEPNLPPKGTVVILSVVVDPISAFLTERQDRPGKAYFVRLVFGYRPDDDLFSPIYLKHMIRDEHGDDFPVFYAEGPNNNLPVIEEFPAARLRNYGGLLALFE